MAEVRTMLEGTLRFVQASGSGRTWATAGTPPSGIFGYVESFSFTSAQTVTTISDRGIPDHQKITQKAPIDVSFDFLSTGSAFTFLTASGASVPMVHLEHRASAAELISNTGYYYQFMGVAVQSLKFTEGKEGNKISVQGRALAMTGPTGSGYLS